MFLVVASQSPATDVMSQGVRAQFATKILLGNANSDVQRMALGQKLIMVVLNNFRDICQYLR